MTVGFINTHEDHTLHSSHLPDSSTSAGAVPAFLASSNSFFFRQSSLDSF